MTQLITPRSLLHSLAAAAVLAFGGSQAASAQSLLYGIGGTDTGAGPNAAAYTLFNFNSTTPGTINNVGTVAASTGFVVTSIAFQPTTGQLYGFQYNAATNQGQLVTINRFSAAVTPLMTPFTIGSISGTAGNTATISFNTTSGAIRLVTGTYGNYRLSAAGVLLGQDPNVAYAPGDVNVNNTFQISTVAYSANTTLFDIDYVNGYLVTQNISTTNNGQLTSRGPLGITLTQGAPSSGFTIGLGDAAFLNSTVSTQGGAVRDNLYSVNLTTGAATSLGLISGSATFNTVDIAAFVPEPGTYALLGLGGAVLLLVVRRQRRAA